MGRVVTYSGCTFETNIHFESPPELGPAWRVNGGSRELLLFDGHDYYSLCVPPHPAPPPGRGLGAGGYRWPEREGGNGQHRPLGPRRRARPMHAGISEKERNAHRVSCAQQTTSSRSLQYKVLRLCSGNFTFVRSSLSHTKRAAVSGYLYALSLKFLCTHFCSSFSRNAKMSICRQNYASATEDNINEQVFHDHTAIFNNIVECFPHVNGKLPIQN